MAAFDHERLAELKHSGRLQTPRVLLESSADASKCTGKLLRYAKRRRAQLIAIGTHARGALSRMFTGSFAETLINESPIPLLIAGPHLKVDLQSPKAILLPTDFTPADRESFTELVRIASQRDWTIHILYREFVPMDTWAGASLLGETWASVDPVIGAEKARAAKDWLQLAIDFGVDTRMTSLDVRDSFCEALLEYAHELDGAGPIIAMLNATCTGLPARLTRDLIRSSPYPLYIAGSERTQHNTIDKT